MQNRARLAVLLAISFGLLAAYGIANFLRQQRETAEQFRNSTQNVVVATKEIPAGTVITEGMVKLAPYLKTSLPTGFSSSVDTIKGKIAKINIGVSEPVLESRLGEKAGLTVLLGPGQRAMAVQVNEVIGVSGFIAPNDHVDVIANITPPEPEGGKAVQVSKVVLQNKRVLSVAQTSEERKDGKPQVASSITLELTPEEVEKLSVASREGQLVLALRSQDDNAIVATKGSTARELLNIAVSDGVPEKKGAPAVTSTKYRVHVYLGDKKSEVEF
jgi:pilus assembly protein CpaB